MGLFGFQKNDRKTVSLFILMLLVTPMFSIYAQIEPAPVTRLTELTTYSVIDKETGILYLDKYGETVEISIKDKTPIASLDKTLVTELTYADYKSEIYPTPEGVKWDIILDKRPTSNIFAYKVEANNYNWYLQLPLDIELVGKEYEKWSINATHAYNEKGELIYHRPIDVIYSYAVYHQEKNNEYKTGKVMHVYRPLIVDAKGVETWASLSYSNGVLYVVVPNEYLYTASYPVTVDPSFGYTTKGATSSTAKNYIRGSNFTIPADGTLTSITTYINNAADNAIDFRTALYNQSLYLLNESSALTLTADENDWYTFNITNGCDLTSGESYFIANWFNDTCTIYFDTGQPTNRYVYDFCELFQLWFDPIPGPTYTKSLLSIYANYTSAVTGDVGCIVNTPHREYYNSSTVLLNLTIQNNTSAPIYNLVNETDDSWVYGVNQTYTTPVNMIHLSDSEGYTLYVWVTNATDTYEFTSRFAVDADGFKAASGSAADVETAIAAAVAAGAPQSVYIPEGTFNITDSAPWEDIDLPEGINLIALYEADANGNLTECYTRIQLPWFANSTAYKPQNYIFLKVDGSNNKNLITRISGINFTAYRAFDSSNVDDTIYRAIVVEDCYETRIDHNYFNQIGGDEVVIFGNGNVPVKAVVDHNWFINDYGNPWGTGVYGTETLGYGVFFTSAPPYISDWDNQTLNVMGQYNNHTLIFDDNTARGVRHLVSTNQGVIYRASHNVALRNNWGYSIFDQHGGTLTTYSGRFMELFNNTINRPNQIYFRPRVHHYRGGGGIIFNETVNDVYDFVALTNDIDYQDPGEWTRDVYIDLTSCTLNNVTINVYKEGAKVNYTLSLPPGYIPYPYPHPLTQQSHLDYYATYDTQPTWTLIGGITITETYQDPPDTWTIEKQTPINTTWANQPCLLSTYWRDDNGLDSYWYETNNTGVLTNTTAQPFADNWGNETITLNSTIGVKIYIRAIANDTAGNVAMSPYFIFTTEPPDTAPTCIITGPLNTTRQNIGSQVNVTWTYNDLDGDAQGWYQIQVDDTAGFGSPTFDSGKLAGAVTTYTVTLSTTPNLYYMRVRVWDTDNNVSAYTAPRTTIADRVNITGLWVNDTTPYEGETVEISCTAALAYDGHVLNGSAPSNDTLTLRSSLSDNIVMTYNGTHWVGSLTKVTVSTANINNYQSVLETNYTITVLGMVGFSETITWGVAPVTGGGGGSALLPLLVAVMMFGMGMVGGGRRRR